MEVIKMANNTNPNAEKIAQEREKKAMEMAKKAQNFPKSTLFALIKAVPNCPNGAFWGFTHLKEIKEFDVAQELMKDKNIKAKQLDSDAVLVEVLPNYIVSAVNMLDSSVLNNNVIESMKKSMVEAETQFEKWLANHCDNYKGFLGVYCINNVPTITYKNTSYPAFRVNETTVLNLLNKWHFVMLDKDNKPMTPANVKNNGCFFKMAHLSPTLTGVFIKVASTLTPEQAKEFQAKFKAQKKASQGK